MKEVWRLYLKYGLLRVLINWLKLLACVPRFHAVPFTRDWALAAFEDMSASAAPATPDFEKENLRLKQLLKQLSGKYKKVRAVTTTWHIC